MGRWGIVIAPLEKQLSPKPCFFLSVTPDILGKWCCLCSSAPTGPGLVEPTGTQKLLFFCLFFTVNTKIHLNFFSLKSCSSKCWNNSGFKTMAVTQWKYCKVYRPRSRAENYPGYIGMTLIFKVYVSFCHMPFNTSQRALDTLQICAQKHDCVFSAYLITEVPGFGVWVEQSHCFLSLMKLTVGFVKGCCSTPV